MTSSAKLPREDVTPSALGSPAPMERNSSGWNEHPVPAIVRQRVQVVPNLIHDTWDWNLCRSVGVVPGGVCLGEAVLWQSQTGRVWVLEQPERFPPGNLPRTGDQSHPMTRR